MKKILSLVIVLAVMFTTVIAPAFAVTSGSVAGVTSPTVTVSPTPTKAGEVKGTADEQKAEESKDTTQEQSWFAKYWLVILGLLAVIVVGAFVFFGKK